MRKFSQIVIAFSFLAALGAHADGGAILTKQTLDGLGITVFASPVPLRAGPADVSVLVQQGERPILDAKVEVAWKARSTSSPEWMPPCCMMDAVEGRIPAIRARSKNKFLYSAIVPLRSSGSSELLVSVRHDDRESLLTCDLEVGAPLPQALAYWPWLVFPPLAIAGFAIHQSLVRSRQPDDRGPKYKVPGRE